MQKSHYNYKAKSTKVGFSLRFQCDFFNFPLFCNGKPWFSDFQENSAGEKVQEKKFKKKIQENLVKHGFPFKNKAKLVKTR